MQRQATRRAIGTVLAAGVALGLAHELMPGARSFTSAGFSLDLTQRDVRIFDNFQDATANSNKSFHPNWPGFTGAALAIWKGAAEWGSLPHGDGSGDPTQAQVGSGGANFDVTWQGYADAVGPLDGNVISARMLGEGILSSLDQVGPNGWRIAFNELYEWSDDPDNPPSGTIDLQAAFTHEYGHALGLGHSNVAGATMFPAGSGAVLARSIEADDAAGVQFLYGVRAASKPVISGVAVVSGVLTVQGSNFAPTNNEVWFTRVYQNTSGDPVVVSGLASAAGGTQIALSVPQDAGPGDVLVKVPGSQGSALSNAFPIDLQGCHPPLPYCSAKVNSLGCYPSTTFAGKPSAGSAGGFVISTGNVLNQANGLYFYSQSGPAATPFLGGTLCVALPLSRMDVLNSAGNPPPFHDCTGIFAVDFNSWVHSGVDPSLVAGSEVWIQNWSRDPADPFSVNLSAALEIQLCP